MNIGLVLVPEIKFDSELMSRTNFVTQNRIFTIKIRHAHVSLEWSHAIFCFHKSVFSKKRGMMDLMQLTNGFQEKQGALKTKNKVLCTEITKLREAQAKT